MIAQLSGRVVSADQTNLILDVQGVGYLVHATGRTLAQIGQPGDMVTLVTELLVREDRSPFTVLTTQQSKLRSGCCRLCRGLAPRPPCPF